VLDKFPLPVHPEGFQLAPAGRRVFLNLPDARQIAVIMRIGGKQTASWKVPGLRANFPLAIPQGGTSDADDVFFDDARQRLYVSCGAGAVDVFLLDGTTIAALARITTSSGARTSLFVPQLDRLFVAARAGLLGGAAAIFEFQPTP
jgi:hypothetical protein